MSHYKAEIDIENSFTQKFSSLITAQRKQVDELMNAGLIVSYALAIDRSKLWIVFDAKSIEQVKKIIKGMPLATYFKTNVYELAFYDSIHVGFPYPSLN